jgi:two-component system phosphate regulon sensor histidine kinase PhoR
MSRNIRWRIGAPYILLILALMAVLGVYVTRLVQNIYLKDLENELISEARLLASILPDQFPADPESDKLDHLAKDWAAELNKRVTIVAQDGTVIGESDFDRAKMDNHASRPEIMQAALSGIGIETRMSDTLGTPMMYVAAAIRSVSGEIVGYVRIGMPTVQIQNDLSILKRTLILVTIFFSLAAGLLALLIANQTTRPIRQLAEAAAQMARGQLESRLIPTTQDEIGELTIAFNEMAAELNAKIQALDAERGRIAAVLEVMTDGVLIVDEAGKVQLVNSAAENMFGVAHSEALGRSLIEALRQHQIADIWEQCRKSGEMQTTTIEISARRLYLQCVATPLGSALQGSTLLLFQNLTRLRRLETVRQDFISNLSHELRTPLASLKALAETLQENAIDDPPAARRFLQRMETELDALTQMVEELLELSRIESGRVPLKMSPTPPSRLIHQAVERLALQAERANLEISIHCPEDLPPVLADERRLAQVIVNLLHNAIKFTPAGGKIDLRAERDGDAIIFTVKDNGIGIPSEELPRIFERFYKTDRARSSGGTGLGLAIARHLVEAHGGQIWAESIEGQGSTFSFSIPIAT